MDTTARRNLKNAMVVAMLDGVVTEQEQSYIDTLREKFNIEQGEFQQLMEEVREDPKRLTVPRDGSTEDTMRVLIEAAASSGDISPEEEKVLKKVAQHLGLGEEDLARLMQNTQEDPAVAEEIEKKCEEIYCNFEGWPAETRDAKFDEIAQKGQAAVIPLLRMLESYRTPDGAEDALEMNVCLVKQLADLGDARAVYYLAQQITLGDTDDEISNGPLRESCAEAISKITGQSFDQTETLGIVNAARRWWQNTGSKEYNNLAF